jgi:NTP pyrophosphatase (non-canonical NTP hydrolase)
MTDREKTGEPVVSGDHVAPVGPVVPADHVTAVADLRAIVRQFVAERDWQQFHAPKNLAMAMAIETAELMEHFQWMDVDESRGLVPGSSQWTAVAEELADVFCYALALANELDIDLTSALRGKMRKNEEKYPVERYQGRYK